MSEGVNSNLKFSTTLKSAQIQNEWDSDTNKNMEMWNFFLPVLSEINSIWVQVLEPEAPQSHASGSNKVRYPGSNKVPRPVSATLRIGTAALITTNLTPMPRNVTLKRS